MELCLEGQKKLGHPASLRTESERRSEYTERVSTRVTSADEVERYRPAVTRYVRYLIRDGAEADDLVQETFLHAHQQRGTLIDSGALESWLYQIATHVSIDRMRQRVRSAARLIAKPAEDLPIPDRRPSPLTIVQQTEMSGCVQQYVAKLADPYRAVLLLHDADGLTAAEIAKLLELPLTTVKMRLHRARRQLQTQLDEACAFGRNERDVFVCEPKPRKD